MRSAREMIDALDLAPHPEGGWYRQTWAAAAGADGRAAGTSILFLLEPGQSSHWHRIDAVELWLFQAGAPLALRLAGGEGDRSEVVLGPDPLVGHVQQQVVAPGEWQAAQAGTNGWTLVACVVTPGFRFEGFEMAPAGWEPR